MTNDAVTLTSTSTDADGPIVAQSWDLDGDNLFDDAAGAMATAVFAQPGTFPVALQVVDGDGAAAQDRGLVPGVRRPVRCPET